MLASNELKPIKDYLPQSPKPAPEIPYNGYPRWYGLVVEPAQEVRSAELFKHVNVHVYLPQFFKSYCRRGGLRYRRPCAVLPGLLFVPTDMIDAADNRDDILEFGHVRAFLRMPGAVGILTKADIDEIRRIEAKLNMPDKPVDAHGAELQVGQRVRFIDPRHERLFGNAIVFEVASDKRIGVEVSALIGDGPQKCYVTAAEIEVV